MAAMPQDEAQFYTPARVRQLLRDYPQLGITRPPQDDERVRVMVSRPSGASWEEPVVRVEPGLAALPGVAKRVLDEAETE